jgi:transcriptional regulator GlxA family with amidase domain
MTAETMTTETLTAQAQNQEAEKVIAFVLYPGLTALDMIGPLQVFRSLQRLDPRFQPVVVGARIAPMDSDTRLRLIPAKAFAEEPQPSVLIVPGGLVPTFRAMSDPAIRRYVRRAAETAEVVGSVCTGALILATVGLLAGRPATTHWACHKVLERLGARYVRRRWVEDGKVITGAGVSAGIDMALHLVAALTDEATARQVQLDLEYDPQPPLGSIDWKHMSPLPRVFRGTISLAAPLIAWRPRRLTALGQ